MIADISKFLKTVNDARDIKRALMSNFEKACLPSTTDEERKRLLSFVVCGGGPTGIEFAAELYDMVAEDLYRYVSVSCCKSDISFPGYYKMR